MTQEFAEVDLDKLIENDKKAARINKTKQIEKQKEVRRQQRKRFEQDLRKRVQQNSKRDQQKPRNPQNQHKAESKPKVQVSFGEHYAVSIRGLLTDISIDDIHKLLGDRKTVSIRTTLRKRDRTLLTEAEPTLMEAVVVLGSKEDADSFIKQYSDKKLDGKYELSFSFVDARAELQ